MVRAGVYAWESGMMDLLYQENTENEASQAPKKVPTSCTISMERGVKKAAELSAKPTSLKKTTDGSEAMDTVQDLTLLDDSDDNGVLKYVETRTETIVDT
ncbi:hypothetical protein BWQ96_03479 [Gracilariopsis chorda]|uniref:Uncharacterized protein n=1 Tax=Gracilariopsis chorda TaxID=448386 RepID=A0A2V3IXB5_9FLOR|nr:hypothetical protein BWQ96_03479 [Gracilariopsis chorda]|eukprot:PXF46788.1 hypothetical protein BWQ96_03479 [Gracilariopsis chorda]